ncbi:TNF receptor-associated factor 6-like isoform X3 [Oopsacas minuta]|uniref:TNF receptor-associated factor 6-like isoform X3 n=1 Tax=Oopsacas minuta TaxID=111878 RepID=A0AAV7JPI5_9METZ|nr:TNF receptor-associated factor 6-like isoform X3 [Oopsacas minuta]
MAEKLADSEGREDLVYIKAEDGSYRGWRVDLLIDKLSNKMEEKILLCSNCRGMLRDACVYEGDLKCGVCIPEGVAWQPVKMNRESVSDKMISCPLKKRGCEWSDRVSTVIHHLAECEFFPVLCPLGCVCLDGERKGKVMKLEKRLIAEHERDSCPLRELVCEFCVNKVKTCEMNPHLEICEHFPVPCPNRCVMEGEEGTRQLKRRDIPVHLANECPLQKVECPYWVYGCREEMERKEMDLHEREFMHIHYRLSMSDMKLKQVETSKLLQDKLDKATERIALLENENESKPKDLLKVKHMERKLATANTKIENLEKQINEKDSELKSIIEVLHSHSSLSTGQLEWKIKGVKQKIQNKENTYSDQFYVGLYKCQGYIQWNSDNTGKVGFFIHIMKGDYDDKLHWPIRYKLTFILLNHINKNNNYELTSQISKEYLEKYPNRLKRPTELRNEGLGISLFLSNTEILKAKYCKEDNITLLIKIELLPAL